MKLLNHPHIIKLYQVRTQVCFSLLLLASVLLFIFHKVSLQILKGTPLSGCMWSQEFGCIGWIDWYL